MRSKGSINKRIINGTTYYYHQYLENGKQVSKSISKADAYDLSVKLYYSGNDFDDFNNHDFAMPVFFGAPLLRMMEQYSSFKKRFCFEQISDYLTNQNIKSKVLILYGLRRTGKTTLIFQSISSLSIKDFAKTAYIKCDEKKTMYDLLDDIRYLTTHGFKYIFIDEITLLDDFIALSGTVSDIYASMAKIILSGTDSLGFMIATHNELYDRSIMIHTTYIPFKEFATVLGIKSIDKYIEYGGTMVPEGIDYNKTIFERGNYINEYVDSSIAKNIIHSLKVYKDGQYFYNLYDLYEKNELENVINRIVEDTNHRFAVSVIERIFKSNDYGSLKQLAQSKANYEQIGTVLNKVDEKKLTDDLMSALNIINVDKQTHKIDENVIKEVEEFLLTLDVMDKIDVVVAPTFLTNQRHVFTQPGLRYSQAKRLVDILINEPSIKQYPEPIINILKEKILSDVKGRMIEDMIILETSKNRNNVFKLVFGIKGDYDMVILNEQQFTGDIFEIKYSKIMDNNQYRHLIDEESNKIFENKYYPINHRIVLYRGENTVINNIEYKNIEDFLLSL